MSDLTSRLGGAQSSLAFKAPVRCATTAAITLSGFQTIDGVTLALADSNLRVLVKNQSDQTTNGIYVAQANAWTRARDFDGNSDFVKGTRIYIANGTANGDSAFVVTTADPITIGTSNIVFAAPSDEASTSAAQAAASATAAAASASGVSAYATAAAASATAAASSATSASSSASSASTSASNASTSASNASTSASSASSSASAASTSATNASSSASSASSSASAAAASATAAQAAAGFTFTYSTTTTMADPGTGGVRFNNATLASVTAIAINDLAADSGNPDVSAWVLTFDDSTNTNKGVLRLRKATAGQNFVDFNVTSLTDNAGWTQLAVTYVTSSGSFSNADTFLTWFDRTGDKGADGAGTGDVVGPGSATDNALARFDTTTGKLIQNSAGILDDSGNLSGIAKLTTTAGRVVGARVHTAAGAVTVAATDHAVIVRKASGAATTVNLPSSPATGQVHMIKDGKGDASTNPLTLTPAAGNIDGAATMVMAVNYQSVTLIYDGTEWGIY